MAVDEKSKSDEVSLYEPVLSIFCFVLMFCCCYGSVWMNVKGWMVLFCFGLTFLMLRLHDILLVLVLIHNEIDTVVSVILDEFHLSDMLVAMNQFWFDDVRCVNNKIRFKMKTVVDDMVVCSENCKVWFRTENLMKTR